MDREPRSIEDATLDTWRAADPTDPLARRLPEATPVRVDLRGRMLGHYRLIKHLGSGGMGSVYLAEPRLGGPQVAVKVLHSELSRDDALRARFSAEARTVNLIGHPNIVRIYDIDESQDGLHYFVMEYLEGTTLSRLPRPLEPGLVASLLAQACDALEAVHRSGVVHRDLKPDNLLVVEHPGEAPLLKVLDFGVAKALHAPVAPEQTLTGQVFGTPAYMAPEQWMGQAVDGRADLYSLGVTGYLLLTGQLPYPRGQVAELVLGDPRALRAPHELVPQVPPALSAALLRVLERNPAHRFASALEFKKALLAAVRPSPRPRGVPVSRAPTHLPIPAPPTRTEPDDPTPPPAWTARVRRATGSHLVVHCSELNRDGLFMGCAEPLPPLATRLEFSLRIGGEEVECVAEVLRQVESAQARVRRTTPGVVLRFVGPSERLRELLSRLRPSRSLAVVPPPADPREEALACL